MEFNFKAMQDSIVEETKDLPPTVGISIALFRLRELMEGYQFALENGYNTVKLMGSNHSVAEIQALGEHL